MREYYNSNKTSDLFAEMFGCRSYFTCNSKYCLSIGTLVSLTGSNYYKTIFLFICQIEIRVLHFWCILYASENSTFTFHPVPMLLILCHNTETSE